MSGFFQLSKNATFSVQPFNLVVVLMLTSLGALQFQVAKLTHHSSLAFSSLISCRRALAIVKERQVLLEVFGWETQMAPPFSKFSSKTPIINRSLTSVPSEQPDVFAIKAWYQPSQVYISGEFQDVDNLLFLYFNSQQFLQESMVNWVSFLILQRDLTFSLFFLIEMMQVSLIWSSIFSFTSLYRIVGWVEHFELSLISNKTWRQALLNQNHPFQLFFHLPSFYLKCQKIYLSPFSHVSVPKQLDVLVMTILTPSQLISFPRHIHLVTSAILIAMCLPYQTHCREVPHGLLLSLEAQSKVALDYTSL